MNKENMRQGTVTSGKPLISSTLRILVTVFIFYFQLANGCTTNFLSPVIVDMSQKFGVDVSAVSLVFVFFQAAYMISSLISGILFSYVDRQILLILMLAAPGWSLFAIPHVTHLILLYILGGLIGFGCGGIDTALTTWIFELWPKAEVVPFLFFFCHSIGTMLPSILVKPFLTTKNPMENSTAVHLQTQKVPELRGSDLVTPFSIAALMMTLTAIIQIVLYVRLQNKSWIAVPVLESPEVTPKLTSDSQKNGLCGTVKIQKRKSNRWRAQNFKVLFALFVISAGAYQGLQSAILQFLPTFAFYSPLGLDKKESAGLLEDLTIAHAVGRGLGTLLVFFLKLSTHYILFSNMGLILLSNLLLWFLGPSSISWLRAASALLGLGMSTVTPALLAYIKDYMQITSRVVMSIILFGGLLASTLPLLIGSLVEREAGVFIHVITIGLIFVFVPFAAIHWITTFKKERPHRDGDQNVDDNNLY